MIQRIQTIFLFLVAVAMILVISFPIWQQVNPSQTQLMTLTAWNLTTLDVASQEPVDTSSKIFIGILAVISAGIAIFSLTQYKNRTRQMFLNMVNSFVMVVNVGLIIWTTHTANALDSAVARVVAATNATDTRIANAVTRVDTRIDRRIEQG